MSTILFETDIKRCNTDEHNVSKLVWNSTSLFYEFDSYVSEVESGGATRRLQRPWDPQGYPGVSTGPQSTYVHPSNGTFYGNELLARQCRCAPGPFYCPVSGLYCTVYLDTPESPGVRIDCSGAPLDGYLRYLLPLSLFLFIFVTVLLFCAPKGYFARMYCRRLICLWDEAMYEAELNRELDAMAQRRRQRMLAQQRVHRESAGNRVYIPGNAPTLGMLHPAGAELERLDLQQLQRVLRVEELPDPEIAVSELTVQLPISVYLKTTRYAKAEDADNCSICLTEFESGDRVGDLKCGHVFHVACLKSWIVQRNHCPLCKSTDMTRPNGQDSEGEEAEGEFR